MLQLEAIVKLRGVHLVNTNTGVVSNVLPVNILGGGFSRIINPDFMLGHILNHRMDTPMMKIIELGLAEIKKMDDFWDFGARVGGV